MATAQELQDLTLHWPLVITTIYPDIGVVVKGNPDSVESLLSVWDTGNPAKAKPSEAELLTALNTVLSNIAGETAVEAVRANAQTSARAIPNFATWTEQQGLDWIATHIGDTPIDALTNLADAKLLMKDQATAFTALWRFVVAFRNELWPNLQDTE